MRYLIAVALAVALVLTLRWGWKEQASFEAQVEHAVLVEEVRRGGTRCPLNDRAIGQAPQWVLAACANGGLGWHEAAQRYGDDAAKVFHVYGADDEFAAVFDELGHAVVPVVAYFVRHGSTQYRLEETFGRGLSRLWNDGRLGFGLAEITPEQYGLIAVHELNRRGHEMLSEFEIVGGVAVRKPLTRVLLGAKNLVLGGASELEVVIARVAYLRAAGRGAVQSLATVGRAAGVAAAVALPYVAITRPHLVAGAGGWLAEQAGLPAWTGVFAAYAVLCLVFVMLARIVLGPVAWSVRAVRRVAGWSAAFAGRPAKPA